MARPLAVGRLRTDGSPALPPAPASLHCPQENVNLDPYFGQHAFSGFGAGGRSFYAVYGSLFAKIAAQVCGGRRRISGSAAVVWAAAIDRECRRPPPPKLPFLLELGHGHNTAPGLSSSPSF